VRPKIRPISRSDAESGWAGRCTSILASALAEAGAQIIVAAAAMLQHASSW
jgi:hypothetical protein